MSKDSIVKLCDICVYMQKETLSNVAACNMCENYDFYKPVEENGIGRKTK